MVSLPSPFDCTTPIFPCDATARWPVGTFSFRCCSKKVGVTDAGQRYQTLLSSAIVRNVSGAVTAQTVRPEEAHEGLPVIEKTTACSADMLIASGSVTAPRSGML